MASPTLTTHAEKVTHAFSVLGAAGIDPVNKQAVATATTTHAEKITHAVNALSNANLASGDSDSSGGLGEKKWIIVGGVVGGVVLLVLLILLFVFLRARRRRRAKAYANVNKGINMQDNSNNEKGVGSNPARTAAAQPGMRGFLMPAWSSSKSKGKETDQAALRGPSVDLDLSSRGPSFDNSYEARGRGLSVDGRARSRDPSHHSRSRSRGPNVGGENRDVFNADKEMMPSESDSMLIGGPKLGERNFESGYEAMDTEYRSAPGGDKRSGF